MCFCVLCCVEGSGPSVQKRRTALGVPFLYISVVYYGNATVNGSCNNDGGFTFPFDAHDTTVCLGGAEVTECTVLIRPSDCQECDVSRTWNSTVVAGLPWLFFFIIYTSSSFSSLTLLVGIRTPKVSHQKFPNILLWEDFVRPRNDFMILFNRAFFLK